MARNAQRTRTAAFVAVRVASVAEQCAREAEARADRWGCPRNSDAQDRRREANAAWAAAQAACARAEWAERQSSQVVAQAA